MTIYNVQEIQKLEVPAGPKDSKNKNQNFLYVNKNDRVEFWFPNVNIMVKSLTADVIWIIS